jgi:hypothetical protein
MSAPGVIRADVLFPAPPDAPEYWYLSFADPDLPTGAQWLGGCYIASNAFALALSMAHVYGCNPGGEVQGAPVPRGLTVKPEYLHRLLDREEIDEAVRPLP